jgi:RNA polymerase sigma factor (sigma-70 family)
MLQRRDPDELWREESALAFAWQYRRDGRALAELTERFRPLVESVAAERFSSSKLDKGVKVTNPTVGKAQHKILKDPELRGHFWDLVQAGWVGFLEAVQRYDGQARLATYARHWIFKRMAEYVRWNWNVVLMPEPSESKVAKGDQIPKTVPNQRLNPFENPCSIDKKATHSRHITISTPREDQDDGSRAPEEWVVGRFHAGTADMEGRFFGADRFECDEYRFRAHENMEAQARAIELETRSATMDVRAAHLTRRKFQIIRARFPWAEDVKNCPDREDEFGFPRKHTRKTIGDALGVSDEWVRRLEEGALAEMGRSAARDRFLIDRLVNLLAKVLLEQRKKRWLKPSFLYEEEMRTEPESGLRELFLHGSGPVYCAVSCFFDLSAYLFVKGSYLVPYGSLGNASEILLQVQVDEKGTTGDDVLAERQYRRGDIIRQRVIKELEANGLCPGEAA